MEPHNGRCDGRKTVGVIGGMGPWATHAFFGHILAATEASTDQEHLHVMVDCVPEVPDRTDYLLGRGPDPRPTIFAAGRRLAVAGADLLVMPCNSASVFSEELEQAAGLPVVRWFDTVVEAIARTRGSTVGVLATTGTVHAMVYQQMLERLGLRALVPDTEGQDAVMAAIYGPGGVKSGTVSPERRKGLLDTAAQLHAQGADVLVLGCTELPLVASAADSAWPCPALDPAILVARRVAALAGAARPEGEETPH